VYVFVYATHICIYIYIYIYISSYGPLSLYRYACLYVLLCSIVLFVYSPGILCPHSPDGRVLSCVANEACLAYVLDDCDASDIICWLKYDIQETDPHDCRCFGVVRPPQPPPTIADQTWAYLNYILDHQVK